MGRLKKEHSLGTSSASEEWHRCEQDPAIHKELIGGELHIAYAEAIQIIGDEGLETHNGTVSERAIASSEQADAMNRARASRRSMTDDVFPSSAALRPGGAYARRGRGADTSSAGAKPNLMDRPI